jgi:N-acetylmuramoyl-L-alanine amidase
MTAFGYTAAVDTELLLKTFRLRFRPRHDGALDVTDLHMIRDLAKRYPVDVNATWA